MVRFKNFYFLFIEKRFGKKQLKQIFEVLPFPISWKGTLAQYVGRLHRMAVGKTEVQVYDYADVDVPVLMRMLAKRKKGYAALGYEF